MSHNLENLEVTHRWAQNPKLVIGSGQTRLPLLGYSIHLIWVTWSGPRARKEEKQITG